MQYNATAAVYWRIHGIFQSPADSFIPMGIEELLHRRTWRGALALHHSTTSRRAAAAPRATAPVPCLLAVAAPPAATASGCPSRGSFSSSRGAQVNTTPLLLRSACRVPPRELRHRELGASGSRISVRRCRGAWETTGWSRAPAATTAGRGPASPRRSWLDGRGDGRQRRAVGLAAAAPAPSATLLAANVTTPPRKIPYYHLNQYTLVIKR
jgi:hypothetical protein